MLAIWSLVPLPFLKPAWTSGSSRVTYCWSLRPRSGRQPGRATPRPRPVAAGRMHMHQYTIFVFLFLTYFVWQTLGPTPSLQMTQFYSFLCLSNIPLYIRVTYIQLYHIFICSSVDGHLGCFHVPAIVNSAAANTGVQLSFWITVFSRYLPNSGIAGSYGSFLVCVCFF